MEQTPSEARLEEYQDYWVKTSQEEDDEALLGFLIDEDLMSDAAKYTRKECPHIMSRFKVYLENWAENITDIPEGWKG